MLPGPARDDSLGHDAAHGVDKDKASPLFTTCPKKEMRVWGRPKKNGEGWGRKNWTFDVKGGFCRSERGTKLKMRRGKGRERGVSINTFTSFFLLTLTIFFLILRWSRAVLSDFISVYFTTSMILMLFVFVLLLFVFVFFFFLIFFPQWYGVRNALRAWWEPRPYPLATRISTYILIMYIIIKYG